MRLRSLVFLSFIVAGGLTACDEPTGPRDSEAVDEADLLFVRAAEDAPDLATTRVSFWAVPNETRSVKIKYVATGQYPAGDCLTFTVPAGAITGTDSVRITIDVIDPKRFDFDFSPAGLEFADGYPALLEINYLWADRDFDGDGDQDEADAEIAASFSYWRQEAAGDPWFELPTVKSAAAPRATTEISGFTRYALASN